jgi:hypothetical protein
MLLRLVVSDFLLENNHGKRPTGVPRRALPSGLNLTFATHLAANPASECQIQNSTGVASGLMVLTFAKGSAETGCER